MGIKIIKAKPKENVVPNKSMHKNYNNLMIMTIKRIPFDPCFKIMDISC